MLEDTREYILSNSEDLAIQILSVCECDSSLNDDTYEDIICHKLSQYINKEELLSLTAAKLHRIEQIFSYILIFSALHTEEVTPKEMNDFIETRSNRQRLE